MDPDLTIVLLGNSGVGKSASGNTILRKQVFDSRQSSTTVKNQISEATADVFGKRILVVNTPGIFDAEEDIKSKCQDLLRSSVPCLFLVVFRVEPFSNEQEKVLEAVYRFLWPQGFKNCSLLFIGSNALQDKSLEDRVFGDEPSPLVPTFSGRCYLFNENGGEEQVRELLEKSGHLSTPGNSATATDPEKLPLKKQKPEDQEKEKLEKLKEELRNLMPEHFNQAERLLEKCFNKDPEEFVDFIKCIKAPQKKADKGYLWNKVKVHSISTGRTCGADQAILEQLKLNKRLLGTKVETTDLQKCDVIIVFCPITSRTGSDVEAAMRDVPGGKPVVLVLMHHTRDFDFSTDVKRWSENYQSVALDVHVLFHETLQGLLKCRRNDEAVKQIHEELNRHSRSGFLNFWGNK